MKNDEIEILTRQSVLKKLAYEAKRSMVGSLFMCILGAVFLRMMCLMLLSLSYVTTRTKIIVGLLLVFLNTITIMQKDKSMKLSQVSLNALLEMTPKDKMNFIFHGTADTGDSCEYALLLGTSLLEAEQRALHAAKLYREGRIRYIIPSGGVTWDNNGEEISECDFMTRILRENDVPDSAIIPENEATTTRENMIYGTLWLNRKSKLLDVDKIMIITSVQHMKRSIALAKCFLPRKISVIGSPVPLSQSKEEWIVSEEHAEQVDTEIRLLKQLVDHGIIHDIEVKIDGGDTAYVKI